MLRVECLRRRVSGLESGFSGLYGSISFGKSDKNNYRENKIVDKKLKRKGLLGSLNNISLSNIKFINEEAYKKGMSNDTYLRYLMKGRTYTPKIAAVESRSANIGRTRLTTLIDGEQICTKTI